ncbi:hypothetical protein EDD85DRAFT_793816 [Armillaria nabsnona]|nr:hypothetical protein EDD85DRAFT_793816 [Armillaria nabsnona]
MSGRENDHIFVIPHLKNGRCMNLGPKASWLAWASLMFVEDEHPDLSPTQTLRHSHLPAALLYLLLLLVDRMSQNGDQRWTWKQWGLHWEVIVIGGLACSMGGGGIVTIQGFGAA